MPFLILLPEKLDGTVEAIIEINDEGVVDACDPSIHTLIQERLPDSVEHKPVNDCRPML